MKRTYIRKRTRLKSHSPKGKLTKEADRLFSLYIRGRDKVCQYPTCNKTDLHCAHIFSRRNINLRWYSDNAIGLCFYHHLHWAHKEPIEFTRFIEEYLGEAKWNVLLMKKNLTEKTDVKLVIAWLKDKFNI